MTRTLTINARTTLPNGATLLALCVKINDTETHYSVTVGRWSCVWRKVVGKSFTETHTVALGRERSLGCTCKDRLYRGGVCKHMAGSNVVLSRV